MFFIVALQLAYEPGTILETVTYYTPSCQNASDGSMENTCFTGALSHPSVDCRKEDTDCKTGQKIVNGLHYSMTGTCLSYTWTWACTYSTRLHCGESWCDHRADCVNGTTCVCPPSMTGDAKRHS